MTKHEAVPVVVPGASVHGEVANVPVPLVVKSTVPVGVLVVPSDESVTVAVQLLVWLVVIELGEQLTVVVVVRLLTVTVGEFVPLTLVECAMSPL